MWDLILSVPDHCLSFYFSIVSWKSRLNNFSIQTKVINAAYHVNVIGCLVLDKKVFTIYGYGSRYGNVT